MVLFLSKLLCLCPAQATIWIASVTSHSTARPPCPACPFPRHCLATRLPPLCVRLSYYRRRATLLTAKKLKDGRVFSVAGYLRVQRREYRHYSSSTREPSYTCLMPSYHTDSRQSSCRDTTGSLYLICTTREQE